MMLSCKVLNAEDEISLLIGLFVALDEGVVNAVLIGQEVLGSVLLDDLTTVKDHDDVIVYDRRHTVLESQGEINKYFMVFK